MRARGFRKDSSRLTTLTLPRVLKLIEVSREYKMPLCLTFIDLKKAFDTVETEALMEVLEPTKAFLLTTIENAMRKLEWDGMGVKVDGWNYTICALLMTSYWCLRSNPLSCPSDFVCKTLFDGSNACCPNPFSVRLCAEAVTNAESLPIPCTGWDDNSCQEGECRRALDGTNYCCRSTTGPISDTYEPQLTQMRTELLLAAISRKTDDDANRIESSTFSDVSRNRLQHSTPLPNRKLKFSNPFRRRLPYYLRMLKRSKNIVY
ncbi:hypothetical protein RB195_010191 [Necator americanus]|uniref:Reverse transcriptase domain-containing protein n=1 Tax=Necator americanus TaxID=51031 RepID=A0ABR1CX99_NECAM